MSSHMVTLLKNEAGQNLVPNENRLRAHLRHVTGPQRNSEKQRKSGGFLTFGVFFCFVNKLITAYNQPSQYLVIFCLHMLQEGLWDYFFFTSCDDFIIDSLSRL